MLLYAAVCCYMLLFAALCSYMLLYAAVRRYMRLRAAICAAGRAKADVRICARTYAENDTPRARALPPPGAARYARGRRPRRKIRGGAPTPL